MSEKQNARISAEAQQDGAAVQLEGTAAEIAALYSSITRALIKSLSRDDFGKKVLLATIVKSLGIYEDFVNENNLRDYLIDNDNEEEEDTTS